MRSFLWPLAPLAAGVLLPQSASGQSATATPSGTESNATLSAGDASASGRIAVNVAAGQSNQEANLALIASGGTALTQSALAQTLADAAESAAGGTANAHIGDQALAGSSGMIAVNVAAGNQNQLANVAIVAIGIDAPTASAELLDQARGSQQPAGTSDVPASSQATASLAPTAFAGSTGLIQANLVGGERNSSSNTFVLTFAGEE